MGDPIALSRRALRRDQVLEVHWPPLPAPPPQLLKMPGMSEWWELLKVWQRSQEQALNRFVNNLQVNVPPTPE